MRCHLLVEPETGIKTNLRSEFRAEQLRSVCRRAFTQENNIP
jgi:hypothetical protein